MYSNIGGKIKGLAKAICIIEAALSAIGGVLLVALDDDLIMYGMALAIIGPVIAWLSSWAMYGFGELIERVSEISWVLRRIDSKNFAHPNAKKDTTPKISLENPAEGAAKEPLPTTMEKM
ncbi:MAG: hypothetical protein E7453_08805 [Ruminococcaceae bacterium]|nr:hypothetical protein [Oscillospiraceae bacterium]